MNVRLFVSTFVFGCLCIVAQKGLAIQVNLGNDGTLVIQGTNGVDRIRVEDEGNEIFVRTYQNNQDFFDQRNSNVGWRFRKSSVRKLRLLAGDGGDRIHNKSDLLAYIYGEGGDDVLIGGDGKDIINGGYGTDHLWGGKSADELYAGKGGVKDYLYGGGGKGDFIDRGQGDTWNKAGDNAPDNNYVRKHRL